MKYIDLSQPFGDQMPVYPGDPEARLEPIAAISKDGFTDHRITSGLHVGTHIDAPLHMLEGAKKITEISVEKFFGKGALVDARGMSEIGLNVLTSEVSKGDVILFLTGFSGKYGTEAYFNDYPVLTEGLAEELIRREIKMVGMDMPSPDRPPFTVHKMLLGKEILIIENLTNVEQLLGAPDFSIVALPINTDADAGFARVVASTR